MDLLKVAPPNVRRRARRAKPMVALVRQDPQIAVDLARLYTANGLVKLANRIRPAAH
jgi:hypothetical protein